MYTSYTPILCVITYIASYVGRIFILGYSKTYSPLPTCTLHVICVVRDYRVVDTFRFGCRNILAVAFHLSSSILYFSFLIQDAPIHDCHAVQLLFCFFFFYSVDRTTMMEWFYTIQLMMDIILKATVEHHYEKQTVLTSNCIHFNVIML